MTRVGCVRFGRFQHDVTHQAGVLDGLWTVSARSIGAVSGAVLFLWSSGGDLSLQLSDALTLLLQTHLTQLSLQQPVLLLLLQTRDLLLTLDNLRTTRTVRDRPETTRGQNRRTGSGTCCMSPSRLSVELVRMCRFAKASLYATDSGLT